MTDDEKKKLKSELLKADLDAHRKLQTWGSSLFLGALGLLAMQLVEWERSPDPMKHIQLTLMMVLLPAIVGLVGFVFLRIVNFRARENSSGLWELADPPAKNRPGWFGWLLALMPLAFGYLVSCDLAVGIPGWEYVIWFLILLALGLITLSIALNIHLRSSDLSFRKCLNVLWQKVKGPWWKKTNAR